MPVNINVSIWLALLAGLASFLSPCVFSLVPAYVSYLSGQSLSMDAAEKFRSAKWMTLLHGFVFVLGFGTVFVVFGLAVSVAGRLLNQIAPFLSKIGGVILIFFGLHTSGLFTLPFLYYDFRHHSNSPGRRGFLSSFLMGVFFSAGWSPCVGPTLGLILTLALNSAAIGQGMFLLIAYTVGMAIPFLISALTVGWVMGILRKYGKVLHMIEIMMGVVMIIVGILLFLGIYQKLANFDPVINFGI